MPRGFNQVDAASPWIANRLWSPLVLRPALWLDAADLSTITTVSGGVSEWRDKSGNARNATQSTAINRPTYESFDPNTGLPSNAIGTGLPAISFDGTNDSLELPTGFLFGATSVSVAMVLRGPTTAGSNNPIFGPSNTFNTGLELLYVSGSYVRIQTTNPYTSGLWPTNNSFAITTLQASPTEVTGENNGATATPQAPGGIPQLAFNGVYTLGRYSNTLYGAFRVCEFVISNESWSRAQRQMMQGYLAWKWNLSSLLVASHPYANRPPLIGDN